MQLTESGLFEKSRLAKEKQEDSEIKEETILSDYENKIGEYVGGKRDTISSEIYYNKGDIITFPLSINVSGFVTGDSEMLEFSIPLSKSIASDVTNIEISTTAFQIRKSGGGYLINSKYSEDSNIGDYFNIRCFGENYITFRYTASSAISGATNNTPISVELIGLIIKFE